MRFRKVNAGDGTIVGKKVYDVDSMFYLGVLQLASRDTEQGGYWLNLQVDRPEQIQIVHRFELLVEDPKGPITNVPEQTKPISPAVGGYYVPGDRDSQSRRMLGAAHEASFLSRGGTGDAIEDETDDEEPEDLSKPWVVIPRPEEPLELHDPKDPDSQVTVHPAGVDYGRSKGMADLAYVKGVLRRGATVAANSGVIFGRFSQDSEQLNVEMQSIITTLRDTISLLNQQEQVLNEHKAAVIAATAGHGKPAPAEALQDIDLALQKVQETRAKFNQALAAQEQAASALAGTASAMSDASVMTRRAGDTLHRYASSF